VKEWKKRLSRSIEKLENKNNIIRFLGVRMGNNKEDYSDSAFWEKVKKFAKAIGCPLLCLALKLYYAAQKPETPVWAKTIIYSSLAYLISPIDAIPDVTPFVGYSDDLGALTVAIGTVSMYVTDDVVKSADEQIKRLIGDCHC
jgi:uncharacterized membrane protein YkvA (DUF1232 family)